MTKICSNCFCEKSASAFYMRKSGTPHPYCKSCQRLDKKAYYQTNKAVIDGKNRRWTERNREKCRGYVRASYWRNHEQELERGQQYNRNNPGKASARSLKWEKEHPEQARQTDRVYQQKRRQNNPGYRALDNVRRRFNGLLHGKTKNAASITQLIGCGHNELRAHIEKQFQSGMAWDNYGKGAGKWEIDHVRPCASFSDLTDPEQLAQCCHYSNLQPMWGRDNVIKGAKYEGVDYRGK